MAVTLWQELRRRQMLGLGGVYIVGAWLVIQVADIVFPAWDIPASAMRYLFLDAILCFPVALAIGWAFDIKRHGVFRTRKTGAGEIVAVPLDRASYGILGALLLVGLSVQILMAWKISGETEPVATVSTVAERRENSIAVLPFENLDANPETGYFSDGVTDEILTRLSTMGLLHVIGRTSSFAFRNLDEGPARISEILGVRYLLHGSVRRDKDTVRVTARLLDESGFQIWGQSYDRKLEGIFALQTEIADSVSSEIVNKVVATGDMPSGRTTTNMEAYNEYLAGKALADSRTKDWQEKATAAFRRAIELDAGFAPPYAGLAVAISVNTSVGPNWEEAKELAEKALALDPDFAQGHAVLGLVQTVLGDAENGLVSLRKAIDIDPSLAIAYSWIGMPLERLGMSSEAAAMMRRGLEVDPINPVLIKNISDAEDRAGQFDVAAQLLLRLTRLPEPPARTYAWLYDLYGTWGRLADGIRAAKDNIRLFGRGNDASNFEMLASAYARLGSNQEADYWHDKFRAERTEDYVPIDSTYFFARTRGDTARLADDLDYLEAHSIFETDDEFYLVYGGLGYLQIGEFRKGIEILERGLKLAQRPYEPQEEIDFRVLGELWDEDSIIHLAQTMAFAYRQVGRDEDALRCLRFGKDDISSGGDGWRNPHGFEDLALQRALRGDEATAYEALERAVQLGWANYYEVVNDPVWAATVKTPRFESLLNRVKSDIDRQRAIVAEADAQEDFRAEVERLQSM